MIPNITKGGSTYGLIHYLRGEGRANEHVSPHVVAGDDFLTVSFGPDEVLPQSSVKEISAYLDAPRKQFGTKVQARVTTQAPSSGVAVAVGYRDAHVWHCSLSLRAEEGPLGDERWALVAQDFMDRMGFTEASGKAPARWVAIHHGVSKNGNDHIHIAASMVREDGTRWEGRWKDYQNAQQACRDLEVKHGLAQVAGPGLGIVERGEHPAERVQAAKAGLDTTAPKELAHRIRAAAVASSSEGEWVRRVRALGVVVKPFYAKGGAEVVRGYRAALKPVQYNNKLVFYGGGQIGRDLTLPRLRENWATPAAESTGEAAGEWAAAFGGRPPVGRGVEALRLSERAPEVVTARFAAFNERLVMTPDGDRAAWADAARDVSGALSAWAKFDPDLAGELRSAAAVVGRSAQLQRKAFPPGRRIKESPMGTALLFLAAKPEDRAKIAGALLMRQVMTTGRALADHHRALGDLRHAQALESGVLARLERVQFAGYAGGPPAPVLSSAERVQRVRDAFTPTQTSSRPPGTRPPLADPGGPARPGRLPGHYPTNKPERGNQNER